MKALTILVIIAVVAAIVVYAQVIPCWAQEPGGVPVSIRTPEQIVSWFSSDFQYQMKMPDRPQTPEETVELKTGDCDDFAGLAAAILADNGVKSDVVIIKYRDLDIMHAICIYQESDGTYSFISNKQLYRTHQRDITAAVAKFYPDYEEIIVTHI